MELLVFPSSICQSLGFRNSSHCQGSLSLLQQSDRSPPLSVPGISSVSAEGRGCGWYWHCGSLRFCLCVSPLQSTTYKISIIQQRFPCPPHPDARNIHTPLQLKVGTWNTERTQGWWKQRLRWGPGPAAPESLLQQRSVAHTPASASSGHEELGSGSSGIRDSGPSGHRSTLDSGPWAHSSSTRRPDNPSAQRRPPPRPPWCNTSGNKPPATPEARAAAESAPGTPPQRQSWRGCKPQIPKGSHRPRRQKNPKTCAMAPPTEKQTESL